MEKADRIPCRQMLVIMCRRVNRSKGCVKCVFFRSAICFGRNDKLDLKWMVMRLCSQFS